MAAFNSVIPTGSGVVPLATWASTGRRQCYLKQHYHFAAVNNRMELSLSLNLLQRSAPTSFLHRRTDESLLRMTPPDLLSLCRVKKKSSQKRTDIDACSDTKGAKMDTKAKMDALEFELSKIVGLDELKLQLRKWAKGMLLDESRRALRLNIGDRRPPHMAFLGNPGTGKTMVARLIGKLLHMLGILSTDKVVEVQRTDLIAPYIGQTGAKTRENIKEAEGGILFVDEAYRLITMEQPSKDYGLEALEEIMSVMDSGEVVVIYAGYSEPMKRVISSNEGFRRRVAKFFHFDDFSCEDLAKILHVKMYNQDEDSLLYGFKLHPSCTVEVVADMIKHESTAKQRKEMNGGLVDIMLVNAKENLDWRIDVGCKDTESLLTITLEDLAAGLRWLNQSQKPRKRRKLQNAETVTINLD